MKFRHHILGAVSALALLAGASQANAQVAPQFGSIVQPSSTHLDATAVVGTLATAINATTSLSFTPPSGQYLYVSEIYFNVCANGTGTAQAQVSFTTTNLPGPPAFEYSIPATANTCVQLGPFMFPNGLKSSAAGTAVTFVTPAAAASNSYGAFVSGWYAP